MSTEFRANLMGEGGQMGQKVTLCKNTVSFIYQAVGGQKGGHFLKRDF